MTTRNRIDRRALPRAAMLLAAAALAGPASAAEPAPTAGDLTGIAFRLQPNAPTYTAVGPGPTPTLSLNGLSPDGSAAAPALASGPADASGRVLAAAD